MSDKRTAELVRSEETPYWRGGTQELELWRVVGPSGVAKRYLLVSCVPYPEFGLDAQGRSAEVPGVETMAFECDWAGNVTDWGGVFYARARVPGAEVMAALGLEVA